MRHFQIVATLLKPEKTPAMPDTAVITKATIAPANGAIWYYLLFISSIVLPVLPK
jgi:hypothetical protein